MPKIIVRNFLNLFALNKSLISKTFMTPTLDYLEKHFANYCEDLHELIRIPSISFSGFDLKTVDQSAEAVSALLKKTGLQNVKILKFGKALPYVYGEWISDPKKPTVLLYAHHDVQPIGRRDVWKSDPFEPTYREGPGGLRLFARGSADDKAGIIVHTAAIDAWLKTTGTLPVNVKVLIEGEEEIGSPHLEEFLLHHKDLVQADVMALTDTANLDCGIPSLTTSLRGMVCLDVELRTLDKTIHSGLWSGPVPDAAMALTKLLSGLVDDNGEIAVAEIRDMIAPLTDSQVLQSKDLPFDDKLFREQSGMIDGAHIHNNKHPLVKIWWEPSLTVNALQSSSRAQAGNTLNDTAWARISVRLSPGMNAEPVYQALKNHLQRHKPWGAKLEVCCDALATPWSIDPESPRNKSVFDKALRALALGYKTKPVLMGCGATIPFVKPFAKALQDAPALLIGVEDPYTNAHGENESLLMSDFKKACLSQVYLLAELGQ